MLNSRLTSPSLRRKPNAEGILYNLLARSKVPEMSPARLEDEILKLKYPVEH